MMQVRGVLNEALSLYQNGRSVAALSKIDAIIAQEAHVDAYQIKGSILRGIKRYAAAEVCYQQALHIFPDNIGILGNYGNLLSDWKRFEEAEECFKKALLISPNDLSQLRNLGLMYYHSDQPKKSLNCFQQLLEKKPDDIDAKWHVALTQLQLGQFKEGWQAYEVRMKNNQEVVKTYPGKRWEGEKIKNKTLFVYLEQGFGDIIQFSRYIPKLLALNVNVIVQTRKPLKRLMETLEGVSFIDDGKVPEKYDYYCSLLSLPALLKLDSEKDQYLPSPLFKIQSIDDGLVFPVTEKKKVAIAWGSKLKPKDRTCPLPMLSFLFFDPNIEVYSIQFDETKRDIGVNHFSSFIKDLSPKIKDFFDTAQILKQMDLVISVDSSPLHLAGTLGVKTFGLLLHYSDWRWLYQRSDTPLYPSVQLFRQQKPDEWSDTIIKLKQDFESWGLET